MADLLAPWLRLGTCLGTCLELIFLNLIFLTMFLWQVEADLPVGQNLQDHLTTMLGPFIIDKPWTFLPSQLLRYLVYHLTTMLGPFIIDKPWTFLPSQLLR